MASLNHAETRVVNYNNARIFVSKRTHEHKTDFDDRKGGYRNR